MSWFVIRGILVVGLWGGGGGYVSWDQFSLRFTNVFISMGDAVMLNTVGICRDLPIMFMQHAYPLGPRDVVLWCIHGILISRFSIRGSIRSSGGIVDSSYMMVSALKCVMTCEFGKRPSWGLRLWYQFGSVVVSIVIVFGLFFAANFAQWRACWVSFFVCGWAYMFPIHLCWNVVPIDPKTLSWENVEENCFNLIGHVSGDEKYECVIWKESIMCSRMAFGNVYCESSRGSFLGNMYLYCWYNHTTLFLNDCMGRCTLCGLFNASRYCSHNHISLCLGMVIK